MFKEKPLLLNPHARLRRKLAILLYVVFMIWIIYSHNKTTNLDPAIGKKVVAFY